MIPFKEFIKSKLPILQTTFGNREPLKKLKEKLPILQTVFGDRKKKSINESNNTIDQAYLDRDTPELKELHNTLFKHYADAIKHNPDENDHKTNIGDYCSTSFELNSHLLAKAGIKLPHPWRTDDAEFEKRKAERHEKNAKNLQDTLHSYRTPKAITVHTGISKEHAHQLLD